MKKKRKFKVWGVGIFFLFSGWVKFGFFWVEILGLLFLFLGLSKLGLSRLRFGFIFIFGSLEQPNFL